MGDWTATGPMYEIAPQVYMVGFAGTYTNPTVKSWLRKAKPVKDDPLYEAESFTLRGWLRGEEFIPVNRYESHSSLVNANPELFGYVPVQGQGMIPTMLDAGWTVLKFASQHPYKRVRAHIQRPDQDILMNPEQAKSYMKTGKVPPARFAESLTEGRSEPILFHALNTHVALEALTNGFFQLGIAPPGGADAQYQKGHPYYLSMAHSANARYGRDRRGGTTIEFDRNYLKAKYKIIPIDYWGGGTTSDRANVGPDLEQEDRLLSKDPQLTIPDPATRLIKAIHVMIPKDTSWPSHNERRLIIKAKSMGIPVHIYDDYKRFHLGMPAAAVDLDKVMPTLKTNPSPLPLGPRWPRKKYLAPYRELLFKTDRAQLSPEAKRLLYSITYRLDELITKMHADIHNERSSNRQEVYRLFASMQKFGLTTLKAYAEFMQKKWSDLKQP
jgi:hypothetical protein